MTPAPVLPEELPRWLPGRVVLASDDVEWRGVKLRSYQFRAIDVELPPVEDFMIVAFLGGCSTVSRRTNDGWLRDRIVPGDVSLLTRATRSHWKSDNDDVAALHVYLDLPLVTRVCEEVFEREITGVHLRDVLKTADPVLFRGAVAIAGAVAYGGAAGSLYVDTVAHEMCVHALRCYSSVSFRTGRDGGGLSALQARRVTEYIAANLEQPLTLDELAAVVHLQRHHFLRQFKRRFDVTPHAYVIKRRLERARRLLAKSTLSIEEIAASVGFSDQSHLTRLFRRCFETTPLTYRMAARS